MRWAKGLKDICNAGQVHTPLLRSPTPKGSFRLHLFVSAEAPGRAACPLPSASKLLETGLCAITVGRQGRIER
jgi:hypothetical protein